MSKLQTVRGTRDLFGDDILKYNLVVDVAKKIANLFNFSELEPPIFEFSEVFERNLGETTDILTKEVYKFKDRGDNYLTLRPEFTAGVVRAFLENGSLSQVLPKKFFSYGAAFRYERPQKGRYRQFHQINFEFLGEAEYMADVEIILMGYKILKDLLVTSPILEINTLGCPEARKNYEDALVFYLEKYKNDLSEDSKVRLIKNPLRILDSKDDRDKKIVDSAPKITEFLLDENKKFFENILEKLEYFNIEYKVNPLLVRGLDYYTSTVFEFTTEEYGSALGGGRYDNMIEQMGGQSVPAVGFGSGIERLMLLSNREIEKNDVIAVIPISENENLEAIKLSENLRDEGFSVDLCSCGKVKKKMNRANQINAKYSIIIGENEVKNGTYLLKDMQSSEEIPFSSDELMNFLFK